MSDPGVSIEMTNYRGSLQKLRDSRAVSPRFLEADFRIPNSDGVPISVEKPASKTANPERLLTLLPSAVTEILYNNETDLPCTSPRVG